MNGYEGREKGAEIFCWQNEACAKNSKQLQDTLDSSTWATSPVPAFLESLASFVAVEGHSAASTMGGIFILAR